MAREGHSLVPEAMAAAVVVGSEDHMTVLARCFRQFAHRVDRQLRFHSSPRASNLCTARPVSLSSARHRRTTRGAESTIESKVLVPAVINALDSRTVK